MSRNAERHARIDEENRALLAANGDTDRLKDLFAIASEEELLGALLFGRMKSQGIAGLSEAVRDIGKNVDRLERRGEEVERRLVSIEQRIEQIQGSFQRFERFIMYHLEQTKVAREEVEKALVQAAPTRSNERVPKSEWRERSLSAAIKLAAEKSTRKITMKEASIACDASYSRIVYAWGSKENFTKALEEALG